MRPCPGSGQTLASFLTEDKVYCQQCGRIVPVSTVDGVAFVADHSRTAEPVEDRRPEYEWAERRFYVGFGAPDGMCWSVREMFSYSTGLDRFIPHLQAMAEGLKRPDFQTYDEGGDYSSMGESGMFVVGLRPMRDDDKTEAQAAAERQVAYEREFLIELMAKYPDPVAAAETPPLSVGGPSA